MLPAAASDVKPTQQSTGSECWYDLTNAAVERRNDGHQKLLLVGRVGLEPTTKGL